MSNPTPPGVLTSDINVELTLQDLPLLRELIFNRYSSENYEKVVIKLIEAGRLKGSLNDVSLEDWEKLVSFMWKSTNDSSRKRIFIHLISNIRLPSVLVRSIVIKDPDMIDGIISGPNHDVISSLQKFYDGGGFDDALDQIVTLCTELKGNRTKKSVLVFLETLWGIMSEIKKKLV